MSATLEYEEEKITVFLEGELDHHSAGIIRASIDEALLRHRPKTLVIDFSHLTFMDSSGIGLVMGRYKLIKPLGGEIIMRNMPKNIRKVMLLAGLDRLGRIENEEIKV